MSTFIGKATSPRRLVRAAAMVVVMVTLILLTTSHSVWDTDDYQTFIPDLPNQIRIGKPADIPRQFLIEEADACLRKEEHVEVVAYVHSAIRRVEQRRQTRLTWVNSTALNMVVVFMVGRAKNDQEREIVRRESELYHDIVQGDYGDHYHLLSYKALSSLYWITRYCSHVPWTLHADDDLLIDTFLLHKLMQDEDETPEEKNKFHCNVLWDWNILRQGKWKVTQQELNERKYPPYCQGIIWFISTKQVSKLLEASASVNFLWVDDAYITGYLAREAKIGLSNLGQYVIGGPFKNTDVGNKLAWFHTNDRTKLWPLILHHHNLTDGQNNTGKAR